ncbi:MAG: peptide deformylase [Parachlamydiales bacterium]|nr:peptide deformylase [Parachlamydiales bacterium]
MQIIYSIFILASLLSLSLLDAEPLALVDAFDPLLDQTCCALSMEEINDPSMQNLFDSMKSFAKGEQSDKQKYVLVGLAAPQIGKNMRVILVDVGADGKGHVSDLRIYINPEIIEMSDDMEAWYEACFSTGNVKGIVERPSRVTVKALDRYGNSIEETHTGYVARIFQHEIDHLNGVRFPDRINSDGLIHIVQAEQMVEYRNYQGWRTWVNTAPQPEWKEHIE